MAKKSKKKKHNINKWYNNEEGVRNAGYDDSQYFDINTEEGQKNILQMQKSMKDPIYFIENFVKVRILDDSLSESDNGRIINIKLRDYQKDIIKNVLNERFLIFMLARQCGKTSTISMTYLWYLLFEDNYNILVLANEHSKAKEIITELKTMYENLPFWIQVGVKKYNENEIVFENGSRIVAKATTKKSGRGGTWNVVYVDEMAFIPENIIEDFMKSSFSTVTSGKTSKFIVTSTPQGRNYFWKMYNNAKSGDSEFKALFYPWYENPNYDEKFKEKIINTFGERFFRREYECVGENTFINIYDKIEKKYLKIKIGDFYKMCENEN